MLKAVKINIPEQFSSGHVKIAVNFNMIEISVNIIAGIRKFHNSKSSEFEFRIPYFRRRKPLRDNNLLVKIEKTDRKRKRGGYIQEIFFCLFHFPCHFSPVTDFEIMLKLRILLEIHTENT